MTAFANRDPGIARGLFHSLIADFLERNPEVTVVCWTQGGGVVHPIRFGIGDQGIAPKALYHHDDLFGEWPHGNLADLVGVNRAEQLCLRFRDLLDGLHAVESRVYSAAFGDEAFVAVRKEGVEVSF